MAEHEEIGAEIPLSQQRTGTGETLLGGRRRVRGPVQFDFFNMLYQNFVKAVVIATLPLLVVAAIVAAYWLKSGVEPARNAARDMASAEQAWFSTLTQVQPAIEELGLYGAPVSELEVVYFAFIDSTRSDKAQHADVLLQVLHDTAEAVRAVRGDVGNTYQLLEPSNRARQRVTAAYNAWTEACSTPPTNIVVGMGWAPGPDPSHARYAQQLVSDARARGLDPVSP
ncbi:MAG: hypothetical protein KTR31_41540 [Myxococcales bacterium]|nr:hypothetical protein [Myxococcales bacterium]